MARTRAINIDGRISLNESLPSNIDGQISLNDFLSKCFVKLLEIWLYLFSRHCGFSTCQGLVSGRACAKLCSRARACVRVRLTGRRAEAAFLLFLKRDPT